MRTTAIPTSISVFNDCIELELAVKNDISLFYLKLNAL